LQLPATLQKLSVLTGFRFGLKVTIRGLGARFGAGRAFGTLLRIFLGEVFMKFVRKSALAVLMCSVLSVAALAKDHGDKKKKKNVPEGGPAIAYLSLAAVACLGAMTLRARTRETVVTKA
jgi:hypothetical protein